MAAELGNFKKVNPAKVTIGDKEEDSASQNVLCHRRHRSKIERWYIIYSGNYDHVGSYTDETGDTIYNGARD